MVLLMQQDSHSRHLSPLPWYFLMLPMVFSAAVRDLWAPDEPRYAEVAKEIFEHGSALVMHLCGGLYPDKPPLLFWLAGLAGKWSGWSEFAMRLPSLLATFLTAWMVMVFARRYWGEIEARWAPIFFLGFAMVAEIGGRLQIDPLLTALCTGALLLGSMPCSSSRTRSAALIGAGLLTGIGALAKGPVAWVNVGLVALVWWILLRRDSAQPRVAPWVWLVTALAAVGPVLLWAVAAAEHEPRLWNALFYDQHVGRVIKADRHPGPVWKSALRLPLFLTPWFFLIAAGLVSWWKERITKNSWNFDEGRLRALSWIAVLLLFYSLIPPKRDLYLLPLYPAAGLFAARALGERLRRGKIETWVGIASAILLAVIGGGVACSGFFFPQVEGLRLNGLLAGLALLLGAAASWRALAGGRPLHWASRIMLGWLCFGVLLTLLILPSLNPFKSSRYLAYRIAFRPEEPVAIPFVGRVRPEGYRFYAGIPTVYATELGSYLERDGENFLGVIAPASWEKLPEAERRKYRVIEEKRIGGKKMLLLGSAEGREPAGR